MKSIGSVLLFFILSTITYSQTAEEIMQHYTNKSGGQEQWDKVSSFKIKGIAKLLNQGGMELPFERIMTKDGKLYTALTVSGMNYISIAFDGQKVWGSNQEMKPEEKDFDTSENTKILKHDFPYPGHNWKEQGYLIEYLGDSLIDNTKTYKIKLTKKHQWVEGKQVDNIMYIFFDVKSFLPIYQESEVVSGPNKGQVMQTYLSDYQMVNGLYYPFTATMKYNDETFQILTTETVEWNPIIDNNIFSMPSNN